MFDKMSVKDLRELISKYKAHHNIKGYHDMKKSRLVAELNRRFEFKDGHMHLKTEAGSVRIGSKESTAALVKKMILAAAPQAVKEKRRIVPTVLAPAPPAVKEKRRIVPTVLAPAPPVKERRTIVPVASAFDEPVFGLDNKKKTTMKGRMLSPGLKRLEGDYATLYEKYKYASEDKHPQLALDVKSKKKKKKKK